ncbi:hypothetical protein PsYK624_153800 [Phanerochaete sordida]|uniref:Uncharacterized protein n=1 Tax=Phanerochaete sordida TaxID=48140 RepID=A0A9P3LKZ0_9APHY|nr:hypothetical protein PsYK624_153800 [Phanerochaete sordida]
MEESDEEDDDSESDEEEEIMDEEEEEEEEDEGKDGAEEDDQELTVNKEQLEDYATVLRKAQEVAAAQERARKAASKRPVQYLKNSSRTKQRWTAIRRGLHEEGQRFISTFFSRKRSPESVGEGTHEAEEDVLTRSEEEPMQEDWGIIGHEEVPTFQATDSIAQTSPSPASSEASLFAAPVTSAAPPVVVTDKQRRRVEDLLAELRQKRLAQAENPTEPEKHSEPTTAAGQYWKDIPGLEKAARLLLLKSKDKKLDVVFRARITSMLGATNLHLNPEVPCTWREASVLASKAAGHSRKHGRTIQGWVSHFMKTGKLPLHGYGYKRFSILDDEDISSDLQAHLLETSKGRFIRAADIVEFMATLKMKEKLAAVGKTAVSERTARRWLKKLDWRYKREPNGMYIDGHERENVVAYRKEFVEWWKTYELCIVTYNNDGNEAHKLTGFPVAGQPFRLILVTHDKFTFYTNNRRQTKWYHSSQKATPVRKGEGESIMVSDFLTVEWGCLKDREE